MARPKPSMPALSAILALVDAEGRLAVRVTPNAAQDAISLPMPGDPIALIIRTTVTPEDGKANAAVLRLVAKALNCPVSALAVLRGATSRNKLIQIQPS